MAGTDWPQMVALYDLLARVAPSPLAFLRRRLAEVERRNPGPSAAEPADHGGPDGPVR